MTAQTLQKKLGVPSFAEADPIFKHLVLKYPPQPITNRGMHNEYSRLVGRLMALLEDDPPAQDREGIVRYINVLFPLIEEYEKKSFPVSKVEPEDMLRFLMEQNNLTETDLAKELGGQSVVSMVLRGKRRLNRAQIKRLAKRFHVSEATFYPAET